MKPSDEKPLEIARGVHQRSDVTRVPDGFVRRAVNVIGSGAGMRRRPGYESLVSGADITALWSNGSRALYVDGGEMKAVEPTGEITTLASGLVGKVCFAQAGEHIYVSSAQRNLRVLGSVVAPWAPPVPDGFATATFSASGALPQAEYTLALQLVDGAGMEGPILEVPLSGSGAITVTGLTVPAGYALAAYLTLPDSGVLYRATVIPDGVTMLTIGGLPTGKPLDQRFLESMPVGADAMFAYNGRLYAIHGEVIFYSEAMRYGVTQLDDNFLQLQAPVDFAAPVLDGVFLGRGGETVFLHGADPAGFATKSVQSPRYIAGTPSPIRLSWFGIEAPADEAWCWMTEGGPVIGMAGGQLIALTDQTLKLSGAERASTAVLEHEGERHIVTTTRNPQADAAIASDLLESEIIRNGRLVI